MKTNKIFSLLAAILICGSTAFTACTNEDNPVTPTDNLAEKIIGKWMEAEIDGQPALTNEKTVMTFVSSTKAIGSEARIGFTPTAPRWSPYLEYDVNISGNKVTVTGHPNDSITLVLEYSIVAIDETQMLANIKHTRIRNGEERTIREKHIRYEKVTTDYSEDIIGLWRGYVTSEEGSEFDDGEEHQWKYKNDGTYVYYIQDDDDNWIANPGQTLSEYFVDGTLLCTRWVNGGIESREWWEIESIKGGVMKWKALRQKEDGTTYVATFAMLRVKEEFGQSDKQVIDLSKLTDNYKAQNGDILTGTNTRYKISITAGATVILDNATIEGTNDYDYAGITCDGDATIILKDGTTNVVRGFHKTRPGIYVPSGSTLTIKGTGTLTASSNGLGAGIGGGDKISCGNIIIAGGTITASGGNGSAGIGGGTGAYDSNTCGAITISGGTVTATGGENAPGIGGGYSSGAEAICGDITITGGTVAAKGGKYAAGIGSGYAYGKLASCGNILISGGTVEAEGSDCSAGIGGGAGLDTGMGYKYESQCGTITIENTVTSVKAIKGSGATNSIGAGNYTGASSGLCICGTVTVGGVEGAVTTSPYTYQP